MAPPTTADRVDEVNASPSTPTAHSGEDPENAQVGGTGPADEAEANFKPKSFQFWSVIVSIFLALFLVALDRTILGTAVPKITDEFNSLGDIGWYGSAYQLTTAASQLVFGRVYKFYDTKRVFLYSILIFEVGSVLCGAAPSSDVLIVGRAIAGIGGAGIFSGNMMIMIPMVPLRKRPMFQGVFGFVFGAASVMGPLVGGAFTQSVSWRWCFYINLPIGGLAGICMMLVFHAPRRQGSTLSLWQQIVQLDPLGTSFFVPSIVCLLLALQWGGSTYAWGNWRIILLLVLFGLLFIAFASVQILMPKTATVPLHIIRRRSIFAGAVFMLCLAGSMLMVIFYLPLWFQVVRGVSPVDSGIYTLPYVLSLVVGSIMSGGITQKLGYYVPAMIVCPSMMAIGHGLMTTFRVDEVAGHWIGYQVIAGLGLGSGMQASGLAAQAVLPMPDVSTGIAIMFFSQQVGGAIFTSVGQNLLSTYLTSHISIPGLDSSEIVELGASNIVTDIPPEYRDQVKQVYNQAICQIFLCATGVALGGVVAALFMEWRNIKKDHPDQQQQETPLAAAASDPETATIGGDPQMMVDTATTNTTAPSTPTIDGREKAAMMASEIRAVDPATAAPSSKRDSSHADDDAQPLALPPPPQSGSSPPPQPKAAAEDDDPTLVVVVSGDGQSEKTQQEGPGHGGGSAPGGQAEQHQHKVNLIDPRQLSRRRASSVEGQLAAPSNVE